MKTQSTSFVDDMNDDCHLHISRTMTTSVHHRSCLV